MPQRMLSLLGVLLGVVGLAVLALAALGGRDLRRAMASGPRWRRKLVAAGFLLLGAAGLSVGLRDVPRDDDGGARSVEADDPVAEVFWAGNDMESVIPSPPVVQVEKLAVGGFPGPQVSCYFPMGLGPMGTDFGRLRTSTRWPADRHVSQIGQRLRLLANMTERGGLAAQVAVKVLSAIESDVADLTHQERTEAASLLRRWLESTGKTLEARLRQRLQALDGSVETDTRVASERQAIQAALDTFLELRRSYCGTAPGVRP